ncbi:MAG TPA: sulfocyanin-like copper-binding protein [Candidatus Acidoferrum sp.]|nr:sulfocyanin-like copper-binding protein [Candidatus Acidoferrum sp.]
MKKPILVLTLLLTIGLLAVPIAISQVHAATQKDLYAGEINSSQYGFGDSASSISTPGPTLTLTAGDTVTVTLHNAGTMSHNFAIVNAKSSTATVLWNAQIDSASNGVPAGSQASVTFTVGAAGNYFYICQVDGHVALGMWGNVVVQSAVPEFPTALVFVFFAVAATALVGYISRAKMKYKITPF